jgi:predicted transcriptional regulator
MDVLHRLQRATANAVRDEIASPPSYSAVRALLAILERKGHVTHFSDGPRYVYEPVAPRSVERRVALKHVVRTFFDGSIADAMVALLESGDQKLDKQQLDELSRRIAAARKEGR